MRRLTSKAMTLTLATGALFATATGTASAADGYHWLALKTPSNIRSVYVSGHGWTNWTAGADGGTIGSTQSPVLLDACYTYPSNDGDWKRIEDGLQVHTNQAPGRQGQQRSNPSWLDNTQLTVLPLTSTDCTAGAQGSSRRVVVPTDASLTFWLQLT
jgi:hypothetical protein